MLQIQGCNGLQQQEHNISKVNNTTAVSISNTHEKSAGKKSKALHALAEKGRRKRINHHLDTLRHFFPQLPKKQKASVLMEAVQRLKELRKQVADHVAITEKDEEGRGNGGVRRSTLFLPGEKDEVKVISYHPEGSDQGSEIRMVKATICCDDRQRLNADLTEAIRSVKGRVVKAEMATVGGRTKAVLVVKLCRDDGDGGGRGEDVVGSLRMALKAVVEDRALSCPVLLGSNLLSSRWANLGYNRTITCGSVSDIMPKLDDPILKTI